MKAAGKKYVIAVDIGTTSTKTLLVDRSGAIRGEHSIGINCFRQHCQAEFKIRSHYVVKYAMFLDINADSKCHSSSAMQA
jgi:glycerol kinase